MSTLATLGAQASLATSPNPITQPGQWLVNGLGAYLLNLGPQKAFANTVMSIVPMMPKGQAPGAAVDQTQVVRMATTCGAGASLGSCGINAIAGDLSRIGWVVMAVVLLARLARLGARGEFRSPAHVIYDLGPRIVGGGLAMQLAGPALILAIKLTTAAALLLSSVFLSVADVQGPLSLLRDLGAAASTLIMAIPLYLTVGFLYVLIEVAEIGLMLLSLAAPILIPLALYGEHGKVATAWFRAITSCLLVLLVAPAGVAASMALVVLLNTVPLEGIMTGAVAGEAGLLGTAIASFVLAKSAFQQTRDSFRLTLEGVQLDGVGNLPGQVMTEVRRGMARGVSAGWATARTVAGDPTGAARLGGALVRHFRSGPSAVQDGAATPDSTFADGPARSGGAEPAGWTGGVGPGATVPGRENPLASPGFIAYCAVQVNVENRPTGALSALADRVEGGSDHRRVTVNERHQLYARFLADRPQEASTPASRAVARPAA